MKRYVTDDIVAALRRDLRGGLHRAGEPLPTVAELRARFGVGTYAVRQALRQLRDEGYLSLRRHVGALVTDKCSLAWKGRIAFVRVNVNVSYFSSRLLVALSTAFEEAGWCVEPVFIPSTGNSEEDPAPLRRYIANGLSFAILYCQSHRIVELLDKRGIPYIVLNGFTRNFPNALGVVREDLRPAYRDLIAAMKAHGVRRVVEFDIHRRIDRGFKNMFFGAGIQMKWIMCDDDARDPYTPFGEEGGSRTLCDMRTFGHRAVAAYFAEGQNRASSPDAVVFDDDYLASGGVTALLEAGLRIPQDIRVVTYANSGNELVLGVTLARIQNDPVSYGEAVTDYVLKLLGGQRTSPPRIVWRFIPGESL